MLMIQDKHESSTLTGPQSTFPTCDRQCEKKTPVPINHASEQGQSLTQGTVFFFKLMFSRCCQWLHFQAFRLFDILAACTFV